MMSEWTRIDPASDLGEHETLEIVVGEFGEGARVRVRLDTRRQPGRTGTVIGWGRGTDAHEHWTREHGDPMTCVYGTQCDALCDEEGPLIRFDDQAEGDETIDWYPGQSMGCLEVAR